MYYKIFQKVNASPVIGNNQTEIENKMAKNEKRPFQHGKVMGDISIRNSE